MFELITLLGGFWFLAFIGLVVVIGIVASEIDNFTLSTATFVVALIGAQVLFDVPVWATIAANPLSLVLFIALFMLIGAVYTLFWRWPEFLRDNAENINSDYKYAFAKDALSFDQYLKSRHYKFTVAKHKDSLATWIITWPFSLVWELSRKPIKYAYKIIYETLGGAFERIGTSVAKRIHEKNK